MAWATAAAHMGLSDEIVRSISALMQLWYGAQVGWELPMHVAIHNRMAVGCKCTPCLPSTAIDTTTTTLIQPPLQCDGGGI
jgi:hypothetical protein